VKTSPYHTSPAFRFGLRTVVVAIISYIATGIAAGFEDWKPFALGVAGAGMNAIVGLLTPVEPFVGVKASGVQVPVPPAEPEKS
jgi:hypothetical protein